MEAATQEKTAGGGGGDKQPPPEKKSLMIPPDEQRCCRNDGVRWRCTKFRMNLGVSKDDDDEGLDTKYCENHYNFFKEQNKKPQLKNKNHMNKKKKKKKISSSSEDDDEDDSSSSSGTETWDSNSLEWKKVANHSKEIQQAAANDTISDIEGGSANAGTKRNEIERAEWSGELEFTDLLTENPSNEMKKKKEMEKMKLPPDEQRCSHTHTTRNTWMSNHGAAADDSVPKTKSKNINRCKNFRMGYGASADDDSVRKSKHCEKHYNYFAEYSKKLKNMSKKKKKKEIEKMKLPPDEHRCSHTSTRCKKNRRSSHGAAASDDSVPNKKYKYRYRCKNFRMGYGAAADDDSVPKTKFCEKHYNYYANYNQMLKKKRNGGGEGAPGHISKKRKTRERTEGSEEPESSTKAREPMVEFESMENYKSKCFELSVELEKKKVECIKIQGELTDLKTRKNADKDGTERAPEDATEYWRKMLSDLESRVLRIENENSKMICVESRVTKLESLVLRDGKGNSKLRCADLHNSETIESEALGSQNDVCEKQRDKNNMSKPNAETSKGENKDSHMYELKTEENVLKNAYDIGQNNKHHELESAVNISSGSRNLSSAGHYVKQGKGWGRGEETPSQAHSEMSKKPLVKLVSDNSGESVEDDSDSSDSKGSLSDHWDRVEMKCRNRNNDREIKWKFEADMLSSFEEDPELCAKAVCALYRHQISAGAKGLFHYSDALRGTTLAKFLMDGACEGDLKKSIKELETLDSKAVEDCKRLARSYSKQLFSIYQKEKDPYFLPAR